MSDLSTGIFGDLSKPATELIKKVSEAIGAIFEPYQIKRKAKAEYQAKIINTKADIESNELYKRAMNRFLIEELNKQKNIESITKESFQFLNDFSNPEEIENDWLVYFYDRAKNISDNEIKTIWSKILAGEANTPGTFSKRTLNYLALMDKYDADLFTQLCKFKFNMNDEGEIIIIYDIYNRSIKDNNLNYGKLKHLESIGLIHFAGNEGNYSINPTSKSIKINYFEKAFFINIESSKGNSIEIGKIALTNTGYQICKLCNAKPDYNYYYSTIKEIQRLGYETKQLD